ncbi:MAG: hypothetical protein OFPII_26630 [Osedax symbiont Rs1]|nr:MAG: hypothetical protein OFPII_26630 [Osedax symbiont Rs1]
MDDAQLIAAAEMSPCVGVCKSDDITGWCFGCGRTKVEIKEWSNYDDSRRLSLVAPLAERIGQLVARRRAARNSAKTGGRRGRSGPRPNNQ